MKTIGKRIEELRKKYNLTQDDLVEKVGMTYVQIGRLVEVLNTTLDYLMNGKVSESNAKEIKDKTTLGLLLRIESLNEMIITFSNAFLIKKSNSETRILISQI